MTIEEMRRYKKERGYTYVQIAELSGVPLGTVQKIFSGETRHPRYETLQALERLFLKDDRVNENSFYIVKKQGEYTLDDYYAMPDERRVELIDGWIYDMAAPTPLHQKIAGEMYRQIANYIMDRGGKCQSFISPIDVQLDCDEKTMVQPDVVILCDEDKLKSWGIYGAPEFLVEVLSPSTKRKDCIKKLQKYSDAGVKEYWIVDPYKMMVLAYVFDEDVYPQIYGMDQVIPIALYDGELEITFVHIKEWCEQTQER